MDATRGRRTRDPARQRWYAADRCRRLVRHLGFPVVLVFTQRCPTGGLPGPAFRCGAAGDLRSGARHGRETVPQQEGMAVA
jgi:hypothetical protein